MLSAKRFNLAWLKEAYQEGLASGDHGELDVEALKAECRAEFGNAAK